MTTPRVPAFGSPLTDREIRVLARAALGMTNAQIGSELFMSEHTVKTHMSHLLRRLGAKDRANAVWLAAVQGILVTRDGAVVGNCLCTAVAS